jgi:hypothetical protein
MIRLRLSQTPFLPLAWGLATCAGAWSNAAANPAALPTPQKNSPDWAAMRLVLESKCYDCHGGKKTKGGVDLRRLGTDPKVGEEFELWAKVQTAVREGDMPPDDAKALSSHEKDLALHWLGNSLQAVIDSNAGDPGPVTLRRLSNAEYDATLRDLTGVDFAPSREFVRDGGGGEGFSNLGDVLFLSPQHLDKYISAARAVAENTSVLPGSGVCFSSQRLGVRGPDQWKAAVEQALYVWYQKTAHPYLPKDDEDLREADYLLACWQYQHQAVTGAGSLEELAKKHRLFPPFLENWWAFLQAEKPESRFLDLTRIPWRELPGPDPANPGVVPERVLKTLQEIQAQRLSWYRPRGAGWASVQRVQQDADALRVETRRVALQGASSVNLVAGDAGDGARGDWLHVSKLALRRQGKESDYWEWLTLRRDTDQKDLATASPEAAPGLKARLEEAESLLQLRGKHPQGLSVGPGSIVLEAPRILALPLPEDATDISATGTLDTRTPDVDVATLQWSLTREKPGDLTRILPGVLTIYQRGSSAQKSYFREFDAMRRVFPDTLERRMEIVAQNFRRTGADNGVYYLSDSQIRALIPAEEQRWLDQALADWTFVRSKTLTPKQQTQWDQAVGPQLDELIAQAWRRPLTPEETAQNRRIYNESLDRGLDRESAAREVLVRAWVAPAFLFKLEQGDAPGVHPLNAWELASRLSYFIWSSLPDAQLRAKAADGSLLQPQTRKAEVLRMLRDPRSAALAREFAGQWFEFHGFDGHNKVDEKKFPEFTPALRQDFAREAEAFFAHLIREDRPVREILLADYTFLNERLARHYGIEGVTGDPLRKVQVSGAGRGGILAMGAVLTKTSYPHRTSPVLRGNWLLHNVLGTPVPPPPNDVPKLDESVAAATTVRERLTRHRADKACASCHDKIDPLGFALEAFDPIGRFRKNDESGAAIDDSAQTRDGKQFVGLPGLRGYLQSHEGEFFSVFSRKLLGYALGRKVLPTDQPLLGEIRERVEKPEGNFSAAVLSIVESKPFTHRRNE